jgi:CBS domain containing-hemolysin-like protein
MLYIIAKLSFNNMKKNIRKGVDFSLDSSDALQLIILVILLVFSAFFSSAETALTTVNRIRIRSLMEEGNKRAKMVLDITEHSQKMLSAILIGNNIVNLSAASLTTTIAYKLGGSMVAIASGILTVLILLFGEITPKTLATIHAERISLSYAPFISLFMKIMTPFIFIINGLSAGVFMILKVDPNAHYDAMTETELRTIVDVSHEDGVIESDEKEMIYNVFDLGDAKAKDVMVPRVHVTFADVNSTYEELISIFREDKFTRLPIYEDTTDNVIGTINMKDLLLYDNTEPFHIRDIMREAYFTYEYKNISELLVEMRQASLNIAIVLDEYGETAGLITLEDILEEIVGEIHDEYDENEDEYIKKIDDYDYIVEGSINLDDLNDNLDLNLSSEDYDSLGGFIIERLDRLPAVGDYVTTEDGIRLIVEKLDKNRIERVHVYLPKVAPSPQ